MSLGSHQPPAGDPARPGEPSASHQRRAATELAALEPAIGPLVTLLGGAIVPGHWEYTEHRLRLQHRPGAGISALYRTPAGTGFAQLGLSTETIHVPGAVSVQVSDAAALPHAAAGAVEDPVPVTVTGWIHPHDPMLPALATAVDQERVAALWGHGEILQSLRTIAYRPLRRAVIRATFVTPGPLRIERTVFLKVGREHASTALLTRHRLMEGSSLPVPRVVEPEIPGRSAGIGSAGIPGIVALEAAPGDGLAAAIRAAAQPSGVQKTGAQQIRPQDFVALLDALPSAAMDLAPRRAWTDGLGRYRQAAALALPGHAGRIETLVGRIERHLESSDRGPRVPTHGDFYEANILMLNGRISALLDLDSLGPGHRVDDLACFLGHLAILPSIGEKNLPAVAALEEFGAVFERTVDPLALWARAGAVALTLVAGARTAGVDTWVPAAEARLGAAEALVDRADGYAAARTKD